MPPFASDMGSIGLENEPSAANSATEGGSKATVASVKSLGPASPGGTIAAGSDATPPLPSSRPPTSSDDTAGTDASDELSLPATTNGKKGSGKGGSTRRGSKVLRKFSSLVKKSGRRRSSGRRRRRSDGEEEGADKAPSTVLDVVERAAANVVDDSCDGSDDSDAAVTNPDAVAESESPVHLPPPPQSSLSPGRFGNPSPGTEGRDAAAGATLANDAFGGAVPAQTGGGGVGEADDDDESFATATEEAIRPAVANPPAKMHAPPIPNAFGPSASSKAKKRRKQVNAETLKRLSPTPPAVSQGEPDEAETNATDGRGRSVMPPADVSASPARSFLPASLLMPARPQPVAPVAAAVPASAPAPEGDNDKDNDDNRKRSIRFADEEGRAMETVFVTPPKSKHEDEAHFANCAMPARIIVLLMNPQDKKFEFVYVTYNGLERTALSDIVRRIRKNATFGPLGRQRYTGLCRRLPNGNEMINSLSTKDYGIEEDEIVIAVPKGMNGPAMARMAEPLLSDEKLVKLVKRAKRPTPTKKKKDSQKSRHRSRSPSPRRSKAATKDGEADRATASLEASRKPSGGSAITLVLLVATALLVGLGGGLFIARSSSVAPLLPPAPAPIKEFPGKMYGTMERKGLDVVAFAAQRIRELYSSRGSTVGDGNNAAPVYTDNDSCAGEAERDDASSGSLPMMEKDGSVVMN